MYDNRIISESQYVVNSVNSSTADNRITKRPYTKPLFLLVKSKILLILLMILYTHATSHNSSDDNSKTFSNELENMERLKSEENLD